VFFGIPDNGKSSEKFCEFCAVKIPNMFIYGEYADMQFVTVSAMEMAGLLWWNTGNDIHFTEFHNEKHLRIDTKL
jgi:hypothetical protein